MIDAMNSSGISLNQVLSPFRVGQVTGADRAGGSDATAQVDGASRVAVENGPVGKSELTEEERKQVDELKTRDAEVRRHEQAHVSAGGQYVTGGPTYEFQEGPDGRQYAIGGEVQIDTAPIEGDPEGTIRKMEQVRRAALAPAEPSAKDRQVAAHAAATQQEARAELREQESEVEGEPSVRGEEKTGVFTPPDRASHNSRNASVSAFLDQAVQQPGSFIDVRA